MQKKLIASKPVSQGKHQPCQLASSARQRPPCSPARPRPAAGSWNIEPEKREKIEPLMGYTASGDMKSQIKLVFDTKEEAIAYAEKHGIAFRVEPPKEPKRRQISYAENFRYDRKTPWTH